MKSIRYSELSSLQMQQLIDDYKAIFTDALADKVLKNGNTQFGIETKWNDWKQKYDKMNTLNCTAEYLLTAPFDELVDIFVKFKALGYKPSPKRQPPHPALDTLADIFKYTSGFDGAIADFFIGHADLLQIHTCYYCEMSYVNTYTYLENGKLEKKRQFDVDHFLPKAVCPCLGLSLFNFVPSCQVCNSRIKLENLPSDVPDELKVLSPSSSNADFETNIAVRLRMIPQNKGLLGKRYIYFRTNKPYDKHVSFFHLEERYEFHKSEALRLKKLKQRYPDSNIRKIAKLLNRKEKTVKEDIFHTKFLTEEGRCFRKLTLDILNNHKI